MWKIISRPRKVWTKVPEGAAKHQTRMPPVTVQDPPERHTRPIRPGEPLAHCAGCHDWTPMRWLPIAERGKKVGQWFECEFCGGRELTLRYLPIKQEMRSPL